jgi:CBS domain-containing protein
VWGHPLDAALSEIARFLAARAPFDALGPEELADLAGQTEIEFFVAGEAILTEEGGPVTFLRVIHSGAVDIVHDGRLLDLLGAGDTFGDAAMLSGLPPGFEARAAEDTLCYRIPVSAARPVLERVRQRSLELAAGSPAFRAVARLIRSPTVLCEPMESIRVVARRMTEAGATSAIVNLRDSFGIVTDRDIRTKIVAAGLPLSAPVATVMTTPVYSVAPDRTGGEVLFELLERGIRHAPVVTESGQLIGVIEDVDLFAAQSRSWFGARRSISRAGTVEELAVIARRLPEVVGDLHAARMRALDVVRVLSALVDALTVRALELAAPAPAPAAGVVWVAVGSQARRELTPASIARGAVVASRPVPAEWARSVEAARSACGFSETGVVARSPEEWATLRAGSSDELGLAVLVERRALWGTPIDPLPVVSAGVRASVVAALAARALASVPPTGFDGDVVLEPDGTRSERLDIRRAAIVPIVELARWGSALAGVVEGSTPERLRAAADHGALSAADARTLADAFEMGLELRIAHHMERLAAGLTPDDSIESAAISPLMRDHLRDVFHAVNAVQRRLRA